MELVQCLARKDADMWVMQVHVMFPALRLTALVLTDTFRLAAASAGNWVGSRSGVKRRASGAELKGSSAEAAAELARIAQQAEGALKALMRVDNAMEDAAQEGELDPEPYRLISSAAAEVGGAHSSASAA